MLKPEEIIIGRRNFMKAAMVVPVAGAYALTANLAKPVKVAWIGAGGEGRVLLENADYSAIHVEAICDIRPDFLKLGEVVVKDRSNPDVRVYTDYRKMLEDGGFEAVVIATPLSTHGPIAKDCLDAGMHVLCEKTMAYHSEECTEMISMAEKKGLILAVGHQRHTNPLYLQAKEMMEKEMIGEVYHIRSMWHRNHSWRRTPILEWENETLEKAWGEKPIDTVIKLRSGLTPEKIEEMPAREQFEIYFEYLQMVAEKNGLEFDYGRWGYESPDMLGNWRLYSKLSHGLMSELGSHQIDVCNWLWGAEPLQCFSSYQRENRGMQKGARHSSA